MADFARWATACETALGPAGTLAERGSWMGTASELLRGQPRQHRRRATSRDVHKEKLQAGEIRRPMGDTDDTDARNRGRR